MIFDNQPEIEICIFFNYQLLLAFENIENPIKLQFLFPNFNISKLSNNLSTIELS